MHIDVSNAFFSYCISVCCPPNRYGPDCEGKMKLLKHFKLKTEIWTWNYFGEYVLILFLYHIFPHYCMWVCLLLTLGFWKVTRDGGIYAVCIEICLFMRSGGLFVFQAILSLENGHLSLVKALSLVLVYLKSVETLYGMSESYSLKAESDDLPVWWPQDTVQFVVEGFL